MRILFAAPIPPPYGGIGNWVLLMQKYMQPRTDVELVDIVNIAPKKRGLDGRSLWDRVVGQGFEMLRLKRELKQKIKEKQPDVVHLTTSGQLAIIRDILFLRTAKKLGIPTVYHIRFGRVPEIAENNTLEWRFLKKAIGLSSMTIAIDDQTYKTLKYHFTDDRIQKVANPFDISSVNVKQISAAKKEVMFLGWCIKTKGIEELLTAWDKLYTQHPEWILKLVGPIDDNYKQELQSRFSMTNVQFEGEKKHEDAMQLLNEASVFILPSYTEGFPNAVLEAMALEKPIIATDVGAISEMLSNHAGIVIPPHSEEAIADALNMVLSDEKLRCELGQNAKKHLMDDYAIDVVFEKYKAIWNEVTMQQ